MAARRVREQGMTLIEVLLATAIGAVLLGALTRTVTEGLQVQTVSRETNDFTYQARLAMERMVAKARSIAPHPLSTPPASTSGDWFSPTMYCLNAGAKRLIETVTTDTSCSGATTLADNVTAFSAQLPVGVGPLDEPAATLSLTLTGANGQQSTTLTTTLRLGGGTL
jgi:prepilin-type N-terminal cleavage/methylation domain-containing protein